jgi:predicted DNA-binding transcriptional regulator AlpA
MHVPEITERFISKAETCQMVSASDSTLVRWEDVGDFPKRIRLSSTKTVWRYSEVLAWLEDKSERRAELAALHAPQNAVRRKEAAPA